MDQDKYNLNWHNYSDHLREMLHEMMITSELTDVTLVCDDKRQFKAHRIILSACSTVFKSIISDLPQNSSIIFLRGIQHQEMEAILKFMYVGVATFQQDRVNEFLKVANSLEVKEICKDINPISTPLKPTSIHTNSHLAPEQTFTNQIPIQNISYNQTHPNPILEFDMKNGTTGLSDSKSDIETKSESQLKTDSAENENSASNRKTINSVTLNSQLQKNVEGMFNCDQRESEFASNSGLIRHFKSKHQGMTYPCDRCTYRATDKGNLSRHVQSIHEGVTYDCNLCKYQTSLQQHLKTHILRRHVGVKNSLQSGGVVIPANKISFSSL